MKKKISILIASVIILIAGMTTGAKSQTIELLAGNTFNGAMNGAILGGATMGLQDSGNLDPIRVGVGLGTLYGIGVGVYDVTRVSKGQQFYISGTFNDGTNTTILVLLDTFYGAAGGAIIASSFMLISKEPLVEGLQYGASAGAWAGFGFGLFDAFVLARGPDFSQPLSAPADGSARAAGLINISGPNRTVDVGLLNPSMTSVKTLSRDTFQTDYAFNMELVNLKIGF